MSVVTDRRSEVLAIPNAALRFRPEGVSPAGPGAAGQADAGGGGARERGAPGGRSRGGDGEEGTRQPVKRTVYVLVDGEPAPREVSTGITYGRVTEITGGELKEGESVIVSSGSQARQRGQGQRGGFRIL